MDLTSRDGDWFLDELHSMSGNINQLLSILSSSSSSSTPPPPPPHPPGVDLLSLVAVVTSTHNVYTSLQDLHTNFRSVILPEAQKLIQAKHPSVITVLSKIQAIEAATSTTLDHIVVQLETQLLNVIMGMQVDKGSTPHQ